MPLTIRPATPADDDAIWAMLEPTLRAGEVFALPRDMDRAAALAYWFAPAHTVFVAVEEETSAIFGSYYIQPNQAGPGSHVANCGYLTAPSARGRGVAGTMCAHSLRHARHSGYRAMQFNLVVSTNLAALHLWTKHGFRILARLPEAFLHPTQGLRRCTNSVAIPPTGPADTIFLSLPPKLIGRPEIYENAYKKNHPKFCK